MVNVKTPSHGQKVDLGENAPIKHEGAGLVPNESLAAESQREGGEFASNEGIHSENLSAAAASSGSSGKTASSGKATSTSSSSNAASSGKATSTGSSNNASSTGSSHNAASSESTEYRDALLEDPSSVDDASNDDPSSRNRSSETTTSGSSASRSADQPTSLTGEAPTYVNSQYIKASGPHGKNIHEVTGELKGGDGIKKAFESDIGGKNDPSRLAEQQMQQHDNAMGRDAGPKDGDLATETKYDALKAEKTV